MAILDTFYLLFKSDTDDLKKGANEVKNIVESLQKFFLTAIPTGLLTAGVKHALDFNTQLAQTSRALGINIEDLNAWRNAVELAGGSGDAFESTLRSLAERLGVSYQTALKILPKYSDALSKLNPANAQRIGRMFGLDEGTILLLQHSRREVDALVERQKQLGAITQKNAEQYLKYNQATIKVRQETQALFSLIATEALPHLIKFYETLEKGIQYFINHKDFVIGGIYAIAAAVTFLGVRFALANLPIYLMSALVIALIGLFALVYDDIQNFLKGNKSLIGYIIDQYPQAAQIIKETFGVMAKAANAVLHPIETLEKALIRIKELFKEIFGEKRTGVVFNQFKGIGDLQNQFSLKGLQRQKANSLISNSDKNVNVNVGDITINTQATDAKGIVSELQSHMAEQLSSVANYFADGVNA